MVKITFYIPTKTRKQKDIDACKIDGIIDKIWPRYKGATKVKATGYYRPDSGKDEIAESYVLSIVTERTRTFEKDLANFKEKIRSELSQDTVLIDWQPANVVW